MVSNPTNHPVSDLVLRRHSPRAFADRPIDDATLSSLFEAARWAPSSFNEQPWRFVYVHRSDPEHAAAVEVLVEGNQGWASKAAVLLFAIARDTLSANGQINRHAGHDVGQSLAWLTVEATERGLVVRQMGGFSRERAVATLGIPEGFTPMTAMALGWPVEVGDPGHRQRKPVSELVYRARFGQGPTP